MTARERGFLLLTGFLGDPERRPLTVAQLRALTICARGMEKPTHTGELTCEDLLRIGCDRAAAARIIRLLCQEEQLQWYLEKGRRSGCSPVTRISEGYPDRLRRVLGIDAPGALWVKGDAQLLQTPTVCLVGSRELGAENRAFAHQVGKQAALQGYTLVSGNARGADRTAQESCLEYGGKVISVVADTLAGHPVRNNVLYVSEDGFDIVFSAQRALQRNRVIHSLGQKVFVAQCCLGKGGTWNGTVNNLKRNYSPVFCFDDGSPATLELVQRGAVPVRTEMLEDLEQLRRKNVGLLDDM